MSLRPSAQRKLDSGRLRVLSQGDIVRKVEAGEYQCHSFGPCMVITQVTDYGYERVLDVVLLIGNAFLPIKERVADALARFGREHGCAAIEALSRPGLEPTLKPLGFRRKKVLLRKEIA